MNVDERCNRCDLRGIHGIDDVLQWQSVTFMTSGEIFKIDYKIQYSSIDMVNGFVHLCMCTCCGIDLFHAKHTNNIPVGAP